MILRMIFCKGEVVEKGMTAKFYGINWRSNAQEVDCEDGVC